MDNLEQEVFASLAFKTIDELKKLLNCSGKIFDSAFTCVMYAPFSRQASKEQHQIYMDNRKLMGKLLSKYSKK